MKPCYEAATTESRFEWPGRCVYTETVIPNLLGEPVEVSTPTMRGRCPGAERPLLLSKELVKALQIAAMDAYCACLV